MDSLLLYFYLSLIYGETGHKSTLQVDYYPVHPVISAEWEVGDGRSERGWHWARPMENLPATVVATFLTIY